MFFEQELYEGFAQEFQEACDNSQHNEIDWMLELGYIPKSENVTTACMNGDLDLLLKLLKYDVDVHIGFLTAVAFGNLHLLDHLYMRVDLNYQDYEGNTAFHLVSDPNIAKWLLDMGGLQIPNNEGETPLHHACMFNRIEIVKFLLDHDAPQLPDNRGNTPLYYVCVRNSIELIKLLLDKKNRLTVVGNRENFLLHDASLCGHTQVAKLLLDYGATQLPDSSGNTPL